MEARRSAGRARVGLTQELPPQLSSIGDHGVAEGLERFAVTAGDVLIGDRAYGTRAGMASVEERGAFFIVRFAWPSVPLITADGQSFSLFEALRSLPDARPGEFLVQLQTPDGRLIAARLVAIRKSEPAAEKARKKALRERTKKGRATVDIARWKRPDTCSCSPICPTTSQPRACSTLYGLRWQIEMKFKTLKSVLHLGNVPARTDETLRVYICAKLLIALLIDSLLDEAESFPPWGYPIVVPEQLAPDSPSA